MQCISESCERISKKFLAGVRSGPRANRLDFGGYADQGPNPGFLKQKQTIFPDNSPTFSKVSDTSLTAAKCPDISRFFIQVVTPHITQIYADQLQCAST